jgi:hypothetical protein
MVTAAISKPLDCLSCGYRMRQSFRVIRSTSFPPTGLLAHFVEFMSAHGGQHNESKTKGAAWFFPKSFPRTAVSFSWKSQAVLLCCPVNNWS